MALLDRLKFWKKQEPAKPAPVLIPVAAPLPPAPEPVPVMTQEEIQAEIGRLVVLIPQCATDHLKAKYQRRLETLIAAAQG